MKKIILIALLLLAIMPLAQASLTTNILKYEPLPARPGQYVSVFVEIQNNDNNDVNNLILEIDDTFPFSVIGDNRIAIGTLASQQSYVAEFKLRVDSEAVVGENTIIIRHTTNENLGVWKEDRRSIRIQTIEPSLAVTGVVMDPAEIVPGEEATVQIIVKNTADITLRDVAVQLGLVVNAGNSVVDLPFIPTNSITEKRVGKISPDAQAILSYTIQAYPDASPGYYKLPVHMRFYDEEGTQTQQSDYIGLIVKAMPELSIYIEDNQKLRQNQEGEVVLRFVNKGISDVKFLDVAILPSEDYELLGSAQAYVGDLDSDDFRTETFKILPKKETITLQLAYDYKDENNNVYSITEELDVRCNCSETNGTSTTPVIIIALLVIVGIIVILRRRKKNAQKKK